MLRTRLASYRPSLRRSARGLATATFLVAGVVAAFSFYLVAQILDDARSTYETEIPHLLKQNRNAVKLESLASSVNSITLTHDPAAERRLLVQIQTLGQSFVFDGDKRLSAGAQHTIENVRAIVALHAAERRPATSNDAVPASSFEDGERQVAALRQDALGLIGDLTDSLTTDAALVADRMATRIQSNATRVQYGGAATLILSLASGLGLFWIFMRHVLHPITASVQGLQAITQSETVAVQLPRARFRELDMIARAIEDYARFAGDLRTSNTTLRELSEQDSLTGLANRRSFDTVLRNAFDNKASMPSSLALLLIDIDHFKQLNDRHGHLVGDHCLRQVALTLKSFSAGGLRHVARYGGEEFAIILSGAVADEGLAEAERLRTAVERMHIYASGSRRSIEITISIGLANAREHGLASPDAMVAAADQALYQAKHSGRNCVRRFASADLVAARSFSAA